MPYLDILIFALIAVILALRLKSVLGQRTGYDETQSEDGNPDHAVLEAVTDKSGGRAKADDGHGIEALMKADPGFNQAEFLKGAASAFEMILTAYASGDKAQLKRLLSYDLLQSFDQSIQQRSADGEHLEITLDDLKDVKMIDAKVFDDTASVTVGFKSTQTRTLTDTDNKPINDVDTGKLDLMDIWTFERDLTLDDPNWKLAETESPDDGPAKKK